MATVSQSDCLLSSTVPLWLGQCGEYLHRDGRRSTTTKGNRWKSPFHLPRMQWRCWQLVEALQQDRLPGTGRAGGSAPAPAAR